MLEKLNEIKQIINEAEAILIVLAILGFWYYKKTKKTKVL